MKFLFVPDIYIELLQPVNKMANLKLIVVTILLAVTLVSAGPRPHKYGGIPAVAFAQPIAVAHPVAVPIAVPVPRIIPIAPIVPLAPVYPVYGRIG